MKVCQACPRPSGFDSSHLREEGEEGNYGEKAEGKKEEGRIILYQYDNCKLLPLPKRNVSYFF